jgi:hypothetical protein
LSLIAMSLDNLFIFENFLIVNNLVNCALASGITPMKTKTSTFHNGEGKIRLLTNLIYIWELS